MNDFAEKIVTLRRRHGMTQAELADKLGVTDKSVSKWERGATLPDVAVLSNISRLFGISVDSLLGLTANEGMYPEYISLEKYLMGEFGYQVPDLHPDRAEVILLSMCPYLDDASHGVALSGRAGECAHSFLFGKPLPSYDEFSRLDKIGVVYVSSVPLMSPSQELDSLVDELEHTRLGAMAVNRFLLEKFSEKMTRLVNSEHVRAIAIENEFVKRYFGWFVSSASIPLLAKMQERISNGNLKLLFVGPPLTWRSEEEKYDQAELKRLVTE